MKPNRGAFILSVSSLSFVSLFFVVTAHAQMEELKNTTPEQRAKLETAFMKFKLQLSPEQVQQVGAINFKYAQQMEPLINGPGRKLGKVRQASAINQAKDQEMQTVLSPDQFGRYMASKEEMRRKVADKVRAKKSGMG